MEIKKTYTNLLVERIIASALFNEISVAEYAILLMHVKSINFPSPCIATDCILGISDIISYTGSNGICYSFYVNLDMTALDIHYERLEKFSSCFRHAQAEWEYWVNEIIEYQDVTC
jgi:hypothetical protein